MAAGEQDEEPCLEAGDFSTWLVAMQEALRGEAGSEVPCDGCTACCRSSQFVHIGPDETETLSHIPAELLFAAPRSPPGHVLLGYDSRGHCPMLDDDRCSIYEHRPRTCRTYDCRVFPATGVGVAANGGDQVLIDERVQRWRFSYAAETDRATHLAVQSAATFLTAHAGHADLTERLPEGVVPRSPTQLAVLAIDIHGAFLGCDEMGRPMVVEPDVDAVRAELQRSTSARRQG